MRLWELEGGDDGEFGHGFGGGADGLPLDFDTDEDEDDDDDPAPPVPVAAQLAPLAPLPQAPAFRLARGHDPGLQLFLRMARDDQEDE